MNLKRRGFLGGALGALISSAAASEEYWGKKLANQPTQFIFGYGSLINTASRNSSASTPIAAIPVRVSAASGFIRTWNDRSPSGFTALGLRRPNAGESAATINGILYAVEGNDMAAFDAREEGYVRVEIPRDKIEALSWEGIPQAGKIWVYVPQATGNDPGVGLPLPDAKFPMLQSYIDVVVEGGLEYGEDFAKELIATTADWSGFWLNDRELARRPWVHDKKSGAVDRLIKGVSHFGDRKFPEPYAASWGKE